MLLDMTVQSMTVGSGKKHQLKAYLSQGMAKCWTWDATPAALLAAMSVMLLGISVQSMTVGLWSTSFCSLCTS